MITNNMLEKIPIPNTEQETDQEAVKQKIIECLLGKYYYTIEKAIEIKEKFNIPGETINLPEVQNAAKQGMINLLSVDDQYGVDNIDITMKIKEEFNVPEEIVQDVAKQGMISCLFRGREKAIEIKEKFNIPGEIINLSEVQDAAKQGMIEWLSKCYSRIIGEAKKIKEEFNVSEETTQQAAKQGMINLLSMGDRNGVDNIDITMKIKEEFNVPEEIVQQAAKQGMINLLSRGDMNRTIEIKEEFNVPEEIVQQAAKQGMINLLSGGYVNYATEIKEEFNVPEEAFWDAIKQGIIECLLREDIHDAKKIIRAFNVSKEIINSQEVQKVVKREIIEKLSNDNRIVENKEINQEDSAKKENYIDREIIEHNEYPFFKYEKKLQKVPKHRQVEWDKENLVFDEYWSYEIDWESIDWKKNAEIAIEQGDYPFSIKGNKVYEIQLSEQDREKLKESIQGLDFSDIKKLNTTEKDVEGDFTYYQKKYNYKQNSNIEYVKNLIITDIVRVISQNNAPDYTFNHVFNGFSSIYDDSKTYFKKEILSQKLFDIETFLNDREWIRDMGGFINFLECFYNGGNFDAFLLTPDFENKKRDNQDCSYLPHLFFAKLIVYFKKHKELPEINSKEFQDIINSKINPLNSEIFKEPYAKHKETILEIFKQMNQKNYTIFRPFSLMGNDYTTDATKDGFWNHFKHDYKPWGGTFSEDKITFCFGENNKMFSTYLKNINFLYNKHPNHTDPHSHYPIEREPGRNIAMRVKDPFRTDYEEIKKPEVLTSHIGQHIPEVYVEQDAHPYLYWVFNHPDFIDPSWCFAEWAVIPTEKKLRILQPIINEIE